MNWNSWAVVGAIVVLVGGLGIGLGIFAFVKYMRRGEPGFRDYVRDPHLWRELEESHARVEDAAEAATSWNDEQIAAAVRRFVFDTKSSRESWAEARILSSLGARTHPVLLNLLRDSSLHSKLIEPTGENPLPEAPFNRMCDLLEDDPPEEAVVLLAPFLKQSSDEIRKSAALTIASVGSKVIVPPIQVALRDADEYVRSYALMGLRRAIEGERLSDACRRELYGDLQRLLTEGKNCDQVATLLLHFDELQATKLFFSDAVFAPDSISLHDVLRALNAKGIDVPRERLHFLIERLKSRPPQYPTQYQLGEALLSLGKLRVQEDRRILEEYLSHNDKVVCRGAAEGLLASHELDGFRQRIWKTVEVRGVEALSLPQRRYNAVVVLDGEVNNGGWSQYFFNPSGDEWRAALAGLEAMDSSQRLSIFREALAKFPASSPSDNREERMQQLSKLARPNGEVLENLDTRYFECTEVIDVITMRYVLKNVDAFK